MKMTSNYQPDSFTRMVSLHFTISEKDWDNEQRRNDAITSEILKMDLVKRILKDQKDTILKPYEDLIEQAENVETLMDFVRLRETILEGKSQSD